jgi:TetR/AcrR family transcriptional regulator of autoinduction and epiphytic fitness
MSNGECRLIVKVPFGRPGRPRSLTDDQRRAMLIDAAETVFMERGYHLATMDDVAQQAGMSKKTVYQVFPGKAVLFEALLIDRLQPLTLAPPDDGLAAEDSLVELLVWLGEFVLSDRQMALMRLMVAEAPKSPEIAEALARMQIGRGRGRLERWLAARSESGEVRVGNPQETASILFGMVLGDTLFSKLLNMEPCGGAYDLRQRARCCVRILLGNAALPPAPPAGPPAGPAPGPPIETVA